jgi:hypothetical protein
MPGLTQADLDAIFTYHTPTGDQPQQYAMLRERAKALGELFLLLVPASAEQTLAIRHLQEAVMFANAGIAIHSPPP